MSLTDRDNTENKGKSQKRRLSDNNKSTSTSPNNNNKTKNSNNNNNLNATTSTAISQSSILNFTVHKQHPDYNETDQNNSQVNSKRQKLDKEMETKSETVDESKFHKHFIFSVSSLLNYFQNTYCIHFKFLIYFF